jgi:FKBP-type peptidyl-prolyl cis-trans isomerase 2
MAVKKGDKVKVEYTGTFEDGEVFDSSEKHGAPLEFEVGAGKMIKGFDEAVLGMEKDEEKEIKLQPAEAYGNASPEMIQKFPRDQFPKDHEPKPGMMLMLKAPNGAQMPASIKEVSDKEITLDMNHPMAGKVLNFKIKLIGVSS